MASPEPGHIAGGREGLVSVCRGGGGTGYSRLFLTDRVPI